MRRFIFAFLLSSSAFAQLPFTPVAYTTPTPKPAATPLPTRGTTPQNSEAWRQNSATTTTVNAPRVRWPTVQDESAYYNAFLADAMATPQPSATPQVTETPFQHAPDSLDYYDRKSGRTGLGLNYFKHAVAATAKHKATLATDSDDSGHPAGATARCNDGTFSYSANHRGTCSHHGGVAEWYN